METFEHKCPECDKIYSTGSNLYRHISQKHSIKKATFRPNLVAKCPLCKENCNSQKGIEDHLRLNHAIEVEKEVFEFSSMNDFSNWKVNIENESKSMFVKQCGAKKVHDKKVCYYYCHRSGSFSSRGAGIRSIKFIGTNKIDAYCPSRIKVTEKESRTVVEYTKTHVGHDIDVDRLKSVKEEKINSGRLKTAKEEKIDSDRLKEEKIDSDRLKEEMIDSDRLKEEEIDSDQLKLVIEEKIDSDKLKPVKEGIGLHRLKTVEEENIDLDKLKPVKKEKIEFGRLKSLKQEKIVLYKLFICK